MIVTDITQIKEQIVHSAELIYRQGKCFHLLVSGGNSIKPFLRTIRENLIPSRTKVYIADERMVTFDSEESNHKLVREFLGKDFEIVSYYNGDLPSLEIGKNIFSATPKIDYAVLGTGEDGHICSLFPNDQSLEAVEDFVFISNSPKPPRERLTVTFNFLERCESGVLLIFGEGKRHLIDNFEDFLPYGIAIQRLGFICCTDYESGGEE